MRSSNTIIVRKEGRDFLSKKAYKELRKSRSIKVEAYAKSIEGKSSVSREMNRKRGVQL